MAKTVLRDENGEISHLKVGNQFFPKDEARVRIGLEELVGKRFNLETLEKSLSELMGEEIKLDDISREDDELSDFNLLGGFGTADDDDGLYGFFDIYFLKMRMPGFDGSDMYITEVGVEFE